MTPIVPDFRVIPFPTLTPAGCSILADRLESAAEHFERWGLRGHVLTRLRLSSQRLITVANDSSYGATLEELRDTANALQVAIDFFQIANVLPDDPIPGMSRELAMAANGNLAGTAAARQPREFQSQYWFGMLLARAGLTPRVVQEGDGRPVVDFVAEIDTLQFGVEIKRPERLRSALGAMNRAANQLHRSGFPGVIVMDLSDCFGAQALTTAAFDHHQTLRDIVEPHFRQHAIRLSQRPLTYSLSDKYKRVACIISFARLVGWRRVDMSQPEGVILVQSTGFPGACSGLITAQTDRLRDRVRGGFEEVAGRPGIASDAESTR